MSLLSITRYSALSLVFLLNAPIAAAEISQERWLKLNQAAVNEHILPSYNALAEKSKTLAMASASLCAAPSEENLRNAEAHFIDTLNAWQGIQHVQFGPIELLMRNFTIQFWPDKKNLTSKQLNIILKNQDPASLEPEFFRTASIAVKGLPAMERILFADDALKQIEENPYRCQFLQSVSDYLVIQTDNTNKEWQEYKQEFSTLISEEGIYENAQEASIDIMKAQVEPLEVIRDLKILRPLGNKGKAKARRLESWRSKNALQNIQMNIQSLHHLYSGLKDYNLFQLLKEEGANDLADSIEQQFITIETTLGKIPTPLSLHLKEPKVKEQLLLIAQELKQLHESLDKTMPALGLQLGFNSRDGD
ncbi:imelysin family protein [Neptuniibacter marinus]|uniref:imelysin family protein n=1 Tax=Neptuniibacter marinus TaxID=1806670 RepID=UPI00082E22B0|nr:imelysin family protein [Neptuniibacter marinus]